MVLKKGASLTEVVIVVSILAFFASLLLFGYMAQIKKGRDGKRKSDIEKIKISFEDYYNDTGCYPEQGKLLVFNCGSDSYTRDGFKPWLEHVPCDPLGGRYFVEVEDSECPLWYIVFVNMEYLHDPALKNNVCFEGCVAQGSLANYAYGSDLANPSAFVGSLEDVSEVVPTGIGLCGGGGACYVVDNAGQCNINTQGCVGPNCYANIMGCSNCCADECRVSSCGY